MKMNSKKSVWILLVLLGTLSFVTIRTGKVSANPGTVMYIDPPVNTAKVGGTLTIAIAISDVYNFFAWEAKLGWNYANFDYVSAVKGPFLDGLPMGAGPLIVSVHEDQAGQDYIHMAVTGLGSGHVEGSGILAYVTLLVQSGTETVEDLYDTILLNSMMAPITHTAEDGLFIEAWDEDINYDGIINIFDLATVGLNYGLSGEAINPPEADVDGSGTVWIEDLAMVALKYGEYAY